MLITNSNTKVSKNFVLSEFFKGDDFELPDALIQAAQILRDWHKDSLTITSTLRKKDTFGYHRYGKAIDLVPTKEDQRPAFIDCFNYEIMCWLSGKGSNLIDKLRQIGITGYGLENTCCHLDLRDQSKCNHTDKYGKYLVFQFSCHYDKDGKIIVDKNIAL